MALTPRAVRFGKAKGSIALERLTRRTRFREQKQLSNQALTRAGFNSSTGQSTEDPDVKRDEELNELRFEVKKMNLENAKASTYQAFDKYLEDNNLAHLRDLINSNPTIKKVWGGDRDLANLSVLDDFQKSRVKTALNKQQLAERQSETAEGNFQDIDTNSLAQQFVSMNFADGTSQPVDLKQLMLASGYTGQMTTGQQAKFNDWVNIFSGSAKAGTDQERREVALASDKEKLIQQEGVTEAQPTKLASEQDLRESKVEIQQAIAEDKTKQLERDKAQDDETLLKTKNQSKKILQDLKTSGFNTKIAEKKFNDIKSSQVDTGMTRVMLSKQENASYTELLTKFRNGESLTEPEQANFERLAAKFDKDQSKNLKVAQHIDDLADANLFSTPPEEIKDSKMRADILALEKAHPWINLHNKLFKSVAGTTKLVKRAAEIPPSTTGYTSNLLTNLENFTTERGADGLLSVNALAQFRQILRHDNFGSQLTATELKLNNETYGTFKEKTGANLVKYFNALDSTIGGMEAAQLYNPEVFHAQHGEELLRLNEAKHRVAVRIKALELLRGITEPSDEQLESVALEAEAAVAKTFKTWEELQQESTGTNDSDTLTNMPKPKSTSKLNLLK